MSGSESGFNCIITDGISFFFSNPYRNTVCLVDPDNKLYPNFINVDGPISLEIGPGVLFVQTIHDIHVYAVDYTYQTFNPIKTAVIPLESSNVFPSMVYNKKENLLYVSNFSLGTIITINTSSGTMNTILTDVQGISGMTIASNVLYFSNFLKNKVCYFTNNVVQDLVLINEPRGLYYIQSTFYICYGRQKTKYDPPDTNYGILAYGTTLDSFRRRVNKNIFTNYLSGNIPLTVVSDGKYIYYTLEKTNAVYKDNDLFFSVSFLDIPSATLPDFDENAINLSVIAKNPNCLNNTAFNSLIRLRTTGSNQSNPIQPVTTLIGRSQGVGIQFNPGIGHSYEELKMRRKAETLKYRNSENMPGYTLSNKQLLSSVVKNGGSYRFSKARLNSILQQSCKVGVDNGNPIVITPPSNSGISDPTFEGYYLNPYIPYYPSL